jgi:hypothetical protein
MRRFVFIGVGLPAMTLFMACGTALKSDPPRSDDAGSPVDAAPSAPDAPTDTGKDTSSALDAGTPEEAAAAPVDAGTDSAVPPEPLVWDRPGDIPLHADFDGDHRPDVGVWRPSTGWWFIVESRSTRVFETPWGLSGDVPVPADYNCDGKAEIAVFRGSNGRWYVPGDPEARALGVPGEPGEAPMVGDFDGDHCADIAIFQRSTGKLRYVKSSTHSVVEVPLTAPYDPAQAAYEVRAVRGDFDGDSKDDPAAFSDDTGTWTYQASSSREIVKVQLGKHDDVPLSVDFDGDGKNDIAVYRPSSGQWIAMLSGSGAALNVVFGAESDIPMPGDYDGDGKSDIVVWRTSDATWRSYSVELVGPRS